MWIEVKGQAGLKTPADKLGLLLESAKPYCTDDEFLAGRAEAFAVLNNKSGFRATRTFAIGMHDQYKTRAREMEELEELHRTTAYGALRKLLPHNVPLGLAVLTLFILTGGTFCFERSYAG